MLYPTVLIAHSWLRWGLLAVAISAVVRCVISRKRALPWTVQDDRLSRAVVALADLQLSLGLLLYLWLSPIVKIAWQDMGGAMKSSLLRFFSIEHVFSMLLAMVALHVGHSKVKRASPETRHRLWLRSVSLFLFFVLAGIPWPFLPYGRSLFRLL